MGAQPSLTGASYRSPLQRGPRLRLNNLLHSGIMKSLTLFFLLFTFAYPLLSAERTKEMKERWNEWAYRVGANKRE